jgi:hypothetical protein
MPTKEELAKGFDERLKAVELFIAEAKGAARTAKWVLTLTVGCALVSIVTLVANFIVGVHSADTKLATHEERFAALGNQRNTDLTNAIISAQLILQTPAPSVPLTSGTSMAK